MSATFDTTNALSGMYLWIIFGYVATLLNCDLQRFLKTYPLAMHLAGLIAFFFLFTVIDTNNQSNIQTVWFKTVLTYFLFVLMTKSKWYFVVPVLALLLIDQTLKKDLAFRQADGQDTTAIEKRQDIISSYINVLIIFLTIVGAIHYLILQRTEYGKQFDIFKFFFGWTRCKM